MLLAVLLPILYFNSYAAFAVVATVFFGAAIWEAFRLFNPNAKSALVVAGVWTLVFAYGFFVRGMGDLKFWFAISVLIWAINRPWDSVSRVRKMARPPFATWPKQI